MTTTTRSLTPCELSVLIYCHVSPGFHEHFQAPSYTKAYQWLKVIGAIRPDIKYDRGINLEGFKTTPEGGLWIERILETPFSRVVDTPR